MRDDEEEDWGFALELVDRQDDFSELTKSRDCLTTTRRKRGNNVIGLGRCASLETAWSWRVSGEGILFRGGKRLQPRLCLWRTNGTVPILSSCEADEEDSAMRLVRFSMVRYHSSSKSAAVERVLQEDLQQKKRIEENEKRQSEHASTQQEHRHVGRSGTQSCCGTHCSTRRQAIITITLFTSFPCFQRTYGCFHGASQYTKGCESHFACHGRPPTRKRQEYQYNVDNIYS